MRTDIKYSHREPELHSQVESEAVRSNVVAVQLCLPQPSSGPSGRVAADKPDQNAEVGDDEQLDRAGQGTGSNNSPSRIPKLRNGDLNICFLNAAFVAFLKIYPDAVHLKTEGERSRAQLIKAIETVFSSSRDGGTTLVDVRRVLHHYKPSPSYEDKPDGGFAVSALLDLLKGVSRETGRNDRLKCSMVITEKEDNPPTHCGEPRSFCRRVPVDTLNLPAIHADDNEGPTDMQWCIDWIREGMAQITETIECGICGINFVAAAVSEYEVMPEVFLIEFNSGPRSIKDVEAAIRWGNVTYKIVAMIHHGNNHYWVSVREGRGSRNFFVIAIGIDIISNIINYLFRLDQI